MALMVAQPFSERSNGAGGAAGASRNSGRARTAEQPIPLQLPAHPTPSRSAL